MVCRMKTTIDISDPLYEDVRRVAKEEKTTVKALVEEGLRRTVAEHKRRTPFTLRRATFTGRGLQQEFADTSWERIRGAAFEGRGG